MNGQAIHVVLLIAGGGIVLTGVKWAILPDRRLPRNRVRHLRIRLKPRLHPGKGHATIVELWSTRKASQQASRRPDCPVSR